MRGPRGCDEDFAFESRLALAKYLVRYALAGALEDRPVEEVAPIIHAVADEIAVDILVGRGLSPRRARQLCQRKNDPSSR